MPYNGSKAIKIEKEERKTERIFEYLLEMYFI